MAQFFLLPLASGIAFSSASSAFSSQMDYGLPDVPADLPSLVFGGPSLKKDVALHPPDYTEFENLVIGSALPPDLKDFIAAFIGRDIQQDWSPQEASQIVAQFEAVNYELKRSVRALQSAADIVDVKIETLGTVSLAHSLNADLCSSWTLHERSCEAALGLAISYLWIHLCGALQYPPLIREVCSNWPEFLLQMAPKVQQLMI